MQAEGFNFRAPCVWLVFSKCCSLTLPLPETGHDRGLLEQVLRDSSAGLCQRHAQLQDIYLFISGVTLTGSQPPELPLLPALTVPDCSMLCSCQR